MKRKHFLPIITVVMLMLIFLPTPQVQTGPISKSNARLVADFTAKRVLFDESHTAEGSSLWAPGNASLFSWILGVHGYNSSTNFNHSLDSGILDDYGVLVLYFPVIALTPAEISAVQSFVEGGGGLLLVGTDAFNSWNLGVTNLNPLSEEYGIEFNPDSVGQLLTAFPPHNITTGVTSLFTKGDDLWGCSLNVTAPASTVVEASGLPIVATSDPGLGRVVCVGTPAPFYKYRHDTLGYGPSHFQFSVNVIDWLAKNPQRTVTIPDTAAIAVGHGPSLSTSELSEYRAFVGLYHDHTTISDGKNTPEEMLEKGLSIGLDFMVITDHSYSTSAGTKGIEGALAMRTIASHNNLDCEIVVGAELSATYHTVGFPLYENAWTFTAQQAVDAIHAQGGIAILAHPTIGSSYTTVYENMTQMGYDAVEIDNSGYFFGGGEDAYRYNFIGASDEHGAEFVGKVLNVAFVKNPSGPNGRISGEDLKEAVLDRRIVVLDRTNGMIIGQAIWVDRFLELLEQAQGTVDSAQTLIDDLDESGYIVGFSQRYVDAADDALEWWNPQRALSLCANATSPVALGLDIQVDFPAIVDTDEDFEIALTFTNNHTFGISVNTTIYVPLSFQVDSVNRVIIGPKESAEVDLRSCHSASYGLSSFSLNVHSFNTTEYLMPVVFRNRGIIDRVDYSLVETSSGHRIDIAFWVGRTFATQISSVALIYDEGTGQKTDEMLVGWNTYELSLGPYSGNINITFHVRVETNLGSVYDLAERNVFWQNETVTTTTTTTTTTSAPLPELQLYILVVVVGLLVAVIVVKIVRRR